MGKKIKIALVIIIILAAFLRLYKLDGSPPSLNWDEVANAYNAYTIAYWGMDEWGKRFPLVFTSFRDDKHPIHIYITAIFIRLFGASDFIVRLPSAFFGVLSVLMIFLLTKNLLKSDIAAIFSALSLAISPYNIHFSRGLWETNFALFFFTAGLFLFYLSLKNKWLLPLSALNFGISVLSVHSSKVVVIPIVLVLIIFYWSRLIKLGNAFFLFLIIAIMFAILFILEPRLLGTARIGQTKFSQEKLEQTFLYKKTGNYYLGYLETALMQYPKHFTYDYLFEKGDQAPRESVRSYGQFHKIELPFFIVGLFFLLLIRSKFVLALLLWLLLSPLPSTLVSNAPNAHRAFFMMGVTNIIIGYGIYKTFFGLRLRFLKTVLVIILLIIFAVSVKSYMNIYLYEYPSKEAIQWQYGMKQIVEFVKEHEEYSQVFMTDIRSQPYIFFLFYLKMPLPEYLSNVEYNNSEASKSYNSVSYFGGYYRGNDGKERRVNLYFGGWDPVESIPDRGRLYIIDSSQYDGLRYKAAFDVKKIIYHPDGGVAFYLVSGL